MKKVLKKMVGLLLAVMMIGSILVSSVSAAGVLQAAGYVYPVAELQAAKADSIMAEALEAAEKPSSYVIINGVRVTPA